MWMNLESVIQSEVSQKEKSKYHILSIYMEYRKMVQMKYLQAGIETQTQKTATWTWLWGKEGWVRRTALTFIYYHVENR